MQKKLIAESNWDYRLEADENDNLFLEVVCGTVAIYTITFQLNEVEKQDWLEKEETALRHLSYNVRDYPERYMQRRV